MADIRSVQPAELGAVHPVLGAAGLDELPPRATAEPSIAEPVDAELLRSLFASTVPGTVGFEEELLLVRRDNWLPADAAGLVQDVGDPRVKPELPACQLEIATSVHTDVAGAVEELRACRALIAAACDPELAPIAAPVHPLLDRSTALSRTERAAGLSARYPEVINRQLVSSLQVHLAFGDADCTLAVYHALRDLLPELAALAASAPFAAGRDTGLCSIRPVIASQLPRQGVPPIIDSWEQFADDLAWLARGGAVADAAEWWWELRPHLRYGTLELRVLDVQATTEQTSAIAQLVQALAAQLTDRYHLGELGPPTPSWKIAENRWAALRDGVGGELLDLRTGEARPTSRCLHDLIDGAEHYAAGGLDGVRAMVENPPVKQLRALGPQRVVPWLAEVFPA
ncbi:carboxylate-amine ligase [Kribbella voronezhensis]|uniref:Putative glutamate--cysteine ligase 2 n=1 Tax=Kribbella voronezhensis TaxID=2512212 RepID=A0A4R7SX09_9ACTN|nr:YbdK family carboxylate-amine ligase [Kribbella voronezhensis]TDU83900.1 carboxylate-amine ligase [Kribbella voronezhensis]